jgi:hypothetical protein
MRYAVYTATSEPCDIWPASAYWYDSEHEARRMLQELEAQGRAGKWAEVGMFDCSSLVSCTYYE